jgi:hypothetical protein
MELGKETFSCQNYNVGLKILLMSLYNREDLEKRAAAQPLPFLTQKYFFSKMFEKLCSLGDRTKY